MGKMKWLDITPDLTAKGRELPTGRVLVFLKDGQKTYLRIMRKSKGKVWGKFVHLYKPSEVKIVDKVRK